MSVIWKLSVEEFTSNQCLQLLISFPRAREVVRRLTRAIG